MKSMHKLALTLCVFWFSGVSAAECKKVVISADSDYPPLHWYDGKRLTGASIEIAVTALQALDIPFEVRYAGPFHQVLRGAQNGEIDMISSLKDTPERREFLAFASVPLFANPIALFVPRERSFSYAGWHDLIGKKGGITQGNQFGNGFDDFLKKNLTIETQQKVHMSFTKLELGQIDYVVTGYYSGLAYLASVGQQNKFMALKPFVTQTDNFIAFARQSPCAVHLKDLNRQLERMHKSGALKAILDKHTALLLASAKS